MTETREIPEKLARSSSENGPTKTETLSSQVTDMGEAIATLDIEEILDAEYITGKKLFAVLFGVTLVAFLIMLDQTIIASAIPRISTTFNSIKDIGWYGSAYLLAISSLQPLTGKLYQFYNSKFLFLGGLGIFEVGSLICGVANTSTLFIVGRAIAGMGSAGSLTGMLTILAASAPLDKRPVYLSLMLGVSSIGLVLGPVLGGVLTQHASWRWCFYINLPFGGITATILAFIRIPDSNITDGTKVPLKGHFRRLDLPGFLFFTPACIMLLLALDWGGVKFSWNSATVIGLLCGSGGALAVFLAVERQRGDTAMIPLALLRMRVFFCAGITTLMSGGAVMLQAYYLPIWFQVVKDVSPTLAGVYYLPSVGAMVLAAVVSGSLVTRLGFYTPFAIIGCALSAIGSGLFSKLTPHSGAGMWAGFQIISGLGRGSVQQQPMLAIQAALPKEKLAIGNAFVMFTQLLGGALFTSFGQTLFSNQLKPALAHFAPEVDAKAVFAVGATAFRSVVPEESVPGVILAYNQALTRVFYLGAGASVLSFATSWGLGWIDLRKKKAQSDTEIEMKV